jgi:phospholipid transport system substrate-binding protein
MAKRSLGSHWRRLTPAQEQEFVRLFTNLLETNYMGEITAYDNKKIVFTNERRDGNYAVVESRVVPESGKAISLDYKLHRRGAEWKVYDVAIENISLVNNYRSQFNRVIANSSFDDLMERLRQTAIDSTRSKGSEPKTQKAVSKAMR